MAKANSSDSSKQHREQERRIAAQAYNEALPYTDPRAQYPAAVRYRETRGGQR